jgi:cytochrome b561
VSRALASRYQPMLVALHWLLALMIMGLLYLGFFVLANMPNSDPKKLDILVWHMTGGMLVLVLMILRIIIRIWSARPATAVVGSPLLDRLASGAHYAFYVIVFLMIASGWSTGWLISSVFQPHGKPLPDTFVVLPTLKAHAILAMLLAILIAGHVAAALYHQFVLKDGLFRRMWFGARTIVPAERMERSGYIPPRRSEKDPMNPSDRVDQLP